MLDVGVRYVSTFGRASLAVDVPAGEMVPVCYAKPQWSFLPGAIGLTRSRRPQPRGCGSSLRSVPAFAIGFPFLLAVFG
ncbi:hypothetical protein ACOCJ7_10140 [Knoellia sp. CPCC 206453]|uniref:hypothetical protein n=1 Tax=Knoellia pratensis TaxID=3404796 RepID=UPI003B42DB49